MTLLNKYLNETILTSTKNKILEDDLQANGVKRFETKWMTENVYEPKLTRSFLTSKYCVKEKFFKRANFSKKKKKKKMYFCADLSRSKKYSINRKRMVVSESLESDEISLQCAADYCEQECLYDGRERNRSREGDQSPSQEMDSFSQDGIALCLPLSGGTTSHDALLGKLHEFSEIPFQANNAKGPPGANNMLFGSSPNFCMPKNSVAFQRSQKEKFAAFASSAVWQPHCLPRSAAGWHPASVAVPDKIITDMPRYKLNVSQLNEDFVYESFASSFESSYDNSIANNQKKQLLNVVSMALMYSSDLGDENDIYTKAILSAANRVLTIDPEFILKVALYARQELQIRRVSNFLLSYSAFHEGTRMYLGKYFESTIVLPTDWIQVAEFFEILNVGESKSFPAALRRVMKKTFSKFDEYQLGKYKKAGANSQKGQKKKQKDAKKSKDAMDVSEEDLKKKFPAKLTLKHLIRRLHIDSPVEHVMSLLGKKYPESLEEFKKSGLPGTWDSSKAGVRMKLTIPETWETQISAHGNKPDVWESLIDNKKLPYMALLRNIKNLICSGISYAHHEKAIEYLKNKNAVMKSRQLPMQFFEAYKATDELYMLQQGIYKPDQTLLPKWKKDQIDKRNLKMEQISVYAIENYKEAISKALEISSINNLQPIPGKSLIICEIDGENKKPGAKLKIHETCIMMGLMCLKACEDCKMIIITDRLAPDTISINEKDEFLDVVNSTCSKYSDLSRELSCDDEEFLGECTRDSLEKVLNYYLKPHSMLSVKLDHFVFFHTSAGEQFDSGIKSFLLKYRHLVNPDLLYTDVNYNVSSSRFSEESLSGKDVFLYGTSTSLIKFIAERSTGGQLTFVENIDVKYNLENHLLNKNEENTSMDLCGNEPMDISDATFPTPLNQKLPKWHTVRIFISSTFKDMLSERDLLIRYVFPELRRRAASVFIRLVEIDLRWGITEADSSTKRAAELCLIEAQKADLFVGLIGERYGTIYDFEPPDVPNLEWVKECPSGLSITELEMCAAALRDPDSSKKKAFFYFRDNSFLKYVPKKWADHFESEDLQSKMKIEELKQKIITSGFTIFHGYPCQFAGTFENKPILGGLDALGNRVMEDLWEAIQGIHNEDPYADTISEEDKYQQYLVDSQSFFIEAKESPIKDLIKEITSKNGIFVITGPSGVGKTAFSVNLLKNMKLPTVVKFFIGISSRSRDVSYMLQYICKYICQLLKISIPVPNLPNDLMNQFPDFLFEVSKCCHGKDLVLLIDGLDHLENNDQRLDWLPLLLPNNVKIICSATENSEAFKVLLGREKHGNSIFIYELPPLAHSEQETFVKEYLSSYRKALDKSASNNNMSKIMAKNQSSNPLYLRVTCDFLRIYATFDDLASKLQKLPSSIPGIFQEVIVQMENEYGSTLVQTILTLLCITKEGLEDNDIHYLLSFVIHMNEAKIPFQFDVLEKKISSLEPDDFLCQVKYCSLMYIISTFAHGQLRHKSFSLVGSEFQNAVNEFYMNKNFLSYSINMHCVLAAYYQYMCDTKGDRSYSSHSGFAFRCLLHHMLNGKLYQELVNLLCNSTFIEAVFRTQAADEFLDYYSSILHDILPSDRKLSRQIDEDCLYSYYDFLSRNFHILHRNSSLVMQQALNEPPGSLVSTNKRRNLYLLENLSRSQMLNYRSATLCGFVKIITASAGDRSKPIVVLGTEDGYIKILDLSTRKVVRCIKAHMSAITCISFMGKNRICVASADSTLSLWDSEDFSRIAVLNGHRRTVTSCCSEPSGFILYSSGWDNSVRSWNLRDGRSISVIDEFRCPVNCIDHHPTKQQIACGLWNGSIELWDTGSMKKMLEFSSLCGAVKSLAYSPDGLNIISAFIQSEISIWSSEEGFKISSLEGHILPVKSLTYSFDDRLFVSGSDDCTLKVWSTEHGSEFSTISESKFCPVSCMFFMSKTHLAVAFQNSEIWIIDIMNGNVTAKTTVEGSTVSAFSKYSDLNVIYQKSESNWYETSLVFGTESGKLMIFDALSSLVMTKGEGNSKITVVIHNCDIIVCGTAEGDIMIHSHPDNRLSYTLQAAHKGFISTFSFLIFYQHLLILSTGNDNVLKLWRVEWEEQKLAFERELFNKHKDSITSSTFYPPCIHQGDRRPGRMSTPEPSDSLIWDEVFIDNLFTGSYDNDIILRKEKSSEKFQGLQSSVVNITCSDDAILGCGNDGAVVMWSRNGKVLTSIPKLDLSSATLTFHVEKEDSDKFSVTLAFVDQDGSIKIEKPLEKMYCCSLDGHSKPITSCCTTNNGQIVSCSHDNSVSLWNVPQVSPDSNFVHSSGITGILFSPSLGLAVSADCKGNLILWGTDIDASSKPLFYCAKKSYSGGFIKTLSWLKNNCFACGISQTTEKGEANFLNIYFFKYNTETQSPAFTLEVKKSYKFPCEISCIDSCPNTDTIVVGLKSGVVSVITSEIQKDMVLCQDWPLAVRLLTNKKCSDMFCISSARGDTKLFDIAEFLEKPTSVESFGVCSNDESNIFTSSMCCGDNLMIASGDSEGVIRIYSSYHLKFMKKVHNDTITDMCILGPYLFTSSLDKTVKGWNLSSYEQVCQFHSNTPVSCISSQTELPCTDYYTLVIGTTSGNINLMKFHCA